MRRKKRGELEPIYILLQKSKKSLACMSFKPVDTSQSIHQFREKNCMSVGLVRVYVERRGLVRSLEYLGSTRASYCRLFCLVILVNGKSIPITLYDGFRYRLVPRKMQVN